MGKLTIHIFDNFGNSKKDNPGYLMVSLTYIGCIVNFPLLYLFLTYQITLIKNKIILLKKVKKEVNAKLTG